jgi:transaldolase
MQLSNGLNLQPTKASRKRDVTLMHQQPSYTQKMVDHPTEGPYALDVPDRTIEESNSGDEVAAIFQRRLVGPIAEKFTPTYTKSGEKGYVSIQGDPIHEDDPEVVIGEGWRTAKSRQTFAAKYPPLKAGWLQWSTL